MTRRAIIDHTVNAMAKLPDDKLREVSDFAAFLLKRHEEHLLTAGLTSMAGSGKPFEFLEKEEDVYTVSDLKEVYHAKR